MKRFSTSCRSLLLVTLVAAMLVQPVTVLAPLSTMLALTVTMLAQPVLALDSQPDTTGGDGTSAPLQGKVVEVGVTLNNLRDARLSINRVRKATANLYDEVTRQEVTMDFNPNAVGATLIMSPRPRNTGVILPARKKWVVASMQEIAPIIKLFKEDVDYAMETERRTEMRDAAMESFKPLKAEAFDLVNLSFQRFKRLEELTGGDTFDQSSIASEAQSLDSEMKKLDRVLKNAVAILQKEQRAARKHRRA